MAIYARENKPICTLAAGFSQCDSQLQFSPLHALWDCSEAPGAAGGGAASQCQLLTSIRKAQLGQVRQRLALFAADLSPELLEAAVTRVDPVPLDSRKLVAT